MEKKYELLKNDTINVNGRILYRIRALRSFSNVKKGDIGGYIEKEDNLSHEGNCWIYDNARVYENALVCGNTRVSNNAQIYGNAKVYENAQVFDYAEVYGNSDISDYAKIFDNAKISDNVRVYGNAKIYDDVEVYGNVRVYGNAIISGCSVIRGDAIISDYAKIYGDTRIIGDAHISDNADILNTFDYVLIKGAGSQARTTTFFKYEDGSIKVNCGCFNGTLHQFEEKVKETHGGNKYAKEYLSIINTIKIHFNINL